MKKVPKTEPVPMDVHLLLHETMINNMNRSLSHTKKRLFDAELTMNLRPADNDPHETAMWESKVDKLVNTHDNLPFPTLYHFKREYEESHLVEAKKTEVSAEWQHRMQMTLHKQVEQLQARVLKNAALHISDLPGSEIRTIENYQGCNSYIRDGKRTLIRKESKGWENPSTSLPEWFGPMYYPEAAAYNPSAKKDLAYQIAFKSSSRHPVSAERQKRAQMERRRDEINTIKRELRSQQKIRRGIAFLTEGERTPNHSRGSAKPRELGATSPPRSPPRSAGLPAASTSTLDTSATSKAPILFDFNDDEHSLGSAVQASTADDDVASVRSGSTNSSLSFFGRELRDRKNRESKTLKGASLSKSRSQPALFEESAESRPSHAPARRRKKVLPPVAVNPIYDSNPFAVKVLDIAFGNKHKPKFFQVKDYTRDAFALQPQQTRFIEYDYVEEEAPPPREEVKAVRPLSPLSPNRARLSVKYSSDIFKVPDCGYVLPKKKQTRSPSASPERPLSYTVQTPTVAAETPSAQRESTALSPGITTDATEKTETTTAVALDTSVLAAASVDAEQQTPHPSPQRMKASVAEAMAPSPPDTGSGRVEGRRESIAGSQGSMSVEIPFQGEFNDTGEVSHLLSPFRSSEQYQKHKLRRAPKTISAIEKKPGFRDVYIAQVLGKPLASPKRLSGGGGGDDGEAGGGGPRFKLSLSEGVELDDSIHEWYVKNDIAVARKAAKKLVDKETQQNFRRALPTIELTLNGLLLEENPYTAKDSLIQRNLHKNTEDMKM